MKHRLTYLAAILVIFFSVGASLIQPLSAKAATNDSACSVFPNAPNCKGKPTSPVNIQGSGPVTKVCPSSMEGFPSQTNNLNAFPAVTSTFYQCEVNWAKDGNGYTPGTNESGATSSNGTVDYCHRNFTGDWLTQCSKGLGKNGQGSANAACGNNEPACLVGFAAGGDSTLNPNIANNGNGGGNTDSQPSCEASGFSLSWIFCPIINGLADAVDGIYSNLVQPLLETKPLDLSNSGNDPTHLFAIWSNFRTYGDIFLVLALLVVVFGESISGGLIDAYTAKKILPRLLIAAILINISIYIVAFAVDITNVIGNGIGSLIEAPFQNAGAFKLKINGSTGDIGMAALVGGSIWAAASLGPLLEFLFLFFLIPAFLTFLAILATVLLRQGLIIFLVIISPVAFALYCLPNTEQYFRKWWDLLFKTLLIYPLIAVIFALANVLSVTIDSTTSGITKTFADFLSIIALFVPLFLIPYSFRLAGGLIGQFHELATNARKQGHEAIKGNANDPDSWRRRTRSKLAQRNAELGLDGRAFGDNFRAVPGSRNWRKNRQARRASSRTNLGQDFFENDSVAKANKGNDQYYLAVANRELAEQKRAAAQQAGKTSEAQSWDQAIASSRITPSTPAIRMAAAQQLASTGFQYSQGQKGYNELAETMASITGATLARDGGGNVTGATGPRAGTFSDAMDNSQFALKGAGRFDLGGINRGAGYNPEAGLNKASLYEIANGKPESITAMAREFGTSGLANTEEHAIAYSELQAMLPNSKGANRDEIVKQMQDLEFRGVKSYMNTSAGTGQKQTQVKYDTADPTHAGWDPVDKQRGWRTERRDITYGDVAQSKARSYERPDPNNIP